MAEPPTPTTHHHQKNYDSYMSLVSDVSRLFESANITLVMSGGTLLGSYMFHDMIPWDDGMDLWIPYRDVHKVKKLFRNQTLRQTLQICSWRPFSVSYEYDYETLSKFPNDGPIGLYYRVLPNDTDTVSEHFFKLCINILFTPRGCGWMYICCYLMRPIWEPLWSETTNCGPLKSSTLQMRLWMYLMASPTDTWISYFRDHTTYEWT